jgi:hypothetical protein
VSSWFATPQQGAAAGNTTAGSAGVAPKAASGPGGGIVLPQAAPLCHNHTPYFPAFRHFRKLPPACDANHRCGDPPHGTVAARRTEAVMRIYLEVVVTIIFLLSAYVALAHIPA